MLNACRSHAKQQQCRVRASHVEAGDCTGAPEAYEAYDQCGGTSGAPMPASAADAAWAAGTCAAGTLCSRQSSYYWQCLPGPPSSPPPPPPAGAGVAGCLCRYM